MRRLLPLSLLALSLTVPSYAHAQDTLEAALEADLELERVTQGLNGPTGADFLPDGRILIIEQGSGDVKLFDEVAGGSPTTVGSITVQAGGERGLLGMVVDPQFATNNRVYFYRSINNRQDVIWTTFDPATNMLADDEGSITTILSGAAGRANHNGGGLQFGPDDNLYIGVGDTGCNCGCSPGTNTRNYFGTCLSNLNGKILRIDRDGNIPATNPLIGETNVADCFSDNCSQSDAPTATGTPRTEIYNWGLRNPWRFSFDSETGHLWIGDVGEVTWEEITISTGPGIHHGWPYREGMAGQANTTCAATTPQSGDCKEPAFAYPRGGGGSVTGGVFINHCSWPAPWRGRYFYGDYPQNRTWYLEPNANRDGVDGDRELVIRHGGGGGPVHYFTSANGMLYFVTANDGEIWRIRPDNPENCGMDAGTPDAGDRDGGDRDGGNVPGDDAAVGDDAGTPPPRDGGAGNTPRDGGPGNTPRDGGADNKDAPEDEGCACNATETGRAGALGFFGLGLLLMYRRRSRR